MDKIHFLIGVIIGFLACATGTFLFIHFFTEYDFVSGYKILKSEGQAGKLIAIGALMNIICFFILLKLQKELMARGVVLATILLTIYTILL